MKKNVLALSIAAMVGGLGFAGAHANGVAYKVRFRGHGMSEDLYPFENLIGGLPANHYSFQTFHQANTNRIYKGTRK